MANFCLPPKIAQTIKDALKSEELNVAALARLKEEDRNIAIQDLLRRQVGDDKLAPVVKDGLEALIKDKQAQVLKQKGLIDKINELDERGILTPENSDEFLRGAVATKLGAIITPDEAKGISERAAAIREHDKAGDYAGKPIEFWQSMRNMDDYLNELDPPPAMKLLTSTIRRGMMLLSIKSPVTNIASNTVETIVQSAGRKIANGDFKSDPAMAMKFAKDMVEVYRKTGYDPTRMLTIQGERKVLGETITRSDNKGAIGKTARFFEDRVFRDLMGAPDVAYSAVNFVDAANIAARKAAKEQGLKGAEADAFVQKTVKESMNVGTTDPEAQSVRQFAQAESTYATYQNDSKYSRLALGIRDIVNKISGDARLGDQVMPFVKTPANVVGAGLDAAGVGFITGGKDIAKGLKTGDKELIQRGTRSAVRAGLGLTVAYALANIVNPEDYIGAYPTNKDEQELLLSRSAQPNSIKINGKWISLDYFGSLGAPFVGVMYARKYGQSPADMVMKYGTGLSTQIFRIPGLDLIKGIKDYYDQNQADLRKGPEAATLVAANTAANYAKTFIIPAIVSDTARGTDNVERNTSTKGLGLTEQFTTPFKASIPGKYGRESLPEKTTVFGEPVKTEGALSEFLFGQRVNTDTSNPVINELTRLDELGIKAVPNRLPASFRADKKDFVFPKDKLPDYQKKIGQQTASDLSQLLKSKSYKEADDNGKKKLIDDVSTRVVDRFKELYRLKKGNIDTSKPLRSGLKQNQTNTDE